MDTWNSKENLIEFDHLDTKKVMHKYGAENP